MISEGPGNIFECSGKYKNVALAIAFRSNSAHLKLLATYVDDLKKKSALIITSRNMHLNLEVQIMFCFSP